MSQTYDHESLNNPSYNQTIKKSPAAIQSRRQLSVTAERILVFMIQHAKSDLMSGQHRHIMTYQQLFDAAGWYHSGNYENLKKKVIEIKEMPVIHWDVLGKEQGILNNLKERALREFQRILDNPGFQGIINTREFQKLLATKEALEAAKRTDKRQYEKTVNQIMDLLFPQFVGNESIFSEINIHKRAVSFQINSTIATMLIDPIIYTDIGTSAYYFFKTRQGLKMFENAMIYSDDRSTEWMPIQKFRDLMGVPEGRYKRYSTLKSDLINPGLEECHMAYTKGLMGVIVDLDEDNSLTPGKSIDQVRLVFRTKEDIHNDIVKAGIRIKYDLFSDGDDGEKLSMNELGVLAREAGKWRNFGYTDAYRCISDIAHEKGVGANYFWAQIHYCEQKAARNIDKTFHGGFLRSAFKNDYARYLTWLADQTEAIAETGTTERLRADEGEAINAEKTPVDCVKERVEQEQSDEMLEATLLIEAMHELIQNIDKPSDIPWIDEIRQKADPVLQVMIDQNRVIDVLTFSRAVAQVPKSIYREITGIDRSARPSRLIRLLDTAYNEFKKKNQK